MTPKISPLPIVLTQRTTIVCNECGFRNPLERSSFDTRCTIWLTCHGCEQPIASRFDGQTADPRDPCCLPPLPAPPTRAPYWYLLEME
jgi:hypothetical protein